MIPCGLHSPAPTHARDNAANEARDDRSRSRPACRRKQPRRARRRARRLLCVSRNCLLRAVFEDATARARPSVYKGRPGQGGAGAKGSSPAAVGETAGRGVDVGRARPRARRATPRVPATEDRPRLPREADGRDRAGVPRVESDANAPDGRGGERHAGGRCAAVRDPHEGTDRGPRWAIGTECRGGPRDIATPALATPTAANAGEYPGAGAGSRRDSGTPDIDRLRLRDLVPVLAAADADHQPARGPRPGPRRRVRLEARGRAGAPASPCLPNHAGRRRPPAATRRAKLPDDLLL